MAWVMPAVCAMLSAACTAAVKPPPRLAHVTPGAARVPPGAPIYAGRPAVSLRVQTRALGVSPDGYARWLAIAHFYDARDKPTLILANSNVQWTPSTGVAQWQNRMRYGQPAAIVSVDRDGPVALTIRPTLPRLKSVVVTTDTRRWRYPRVVAAAIGPHLAEVGWFPYSAVPVGITRIDARGNRVALGEVSGGSHFYDTGVRPGAVYRYAVRRAGGRPALTGFVRVPRSLPQTPVSNVSGSGVWLFFTANPIDPEYYRNLDPRAIVRRAIEAHLHYVELRVAYGEYFQIGVPEKARVDAIVDGLESHGIGVIAWVVPREVSFEDLHAAVEAASYRTAEGRRFAGLAVDVERGRDYMGNGAESFAAIGEYLRRLREAVGRRYLLVAIVEDPFFERLSNATYPYREIAAQASVLQPMAYWRMMRGRPPKDSAQVEAEMRDSYHELIRVAGRTIPVSIGGQTSAITATGYPPAAEIRASMTAARHAGAIGEAFFAWDNTLPQQWAAIARFKWNDHERRSTMSRRTSRSTRRESFRSVRCRT